MKKKNTIEVEGKTYIELDFIIGSMLKMVSVENTGIVELKKESATVAVLTDKVPATPPAKRRGRKPGSKNKKAVEAVAPVEAK